MPHWLPDIDIAIGSASRSFLPEMADIGRGSGRFDVELHQELLGTVGFDVVNFRCREIHAHQDLGFQFISKDIDLRRVEVELRAFRWAPDPPTAFVYVDAAQSLVAPILTEYNRAYGTQYRLRVEKRSRSEFKISARTGALIDRFAVLANRSSLHPLDWERFYRLVEESRQEVPGPQMRAVLVGHGFSPEEAGRLADVYAHLWAFKHLR